MKTLPPESAGLLLASAIVQVGHSSPKIANGEQALLAIAALRAAEQRGVERARMACLTTGLQKGLIGTRIDRAFVQGCRASADAIRALAQGGEE